MKDIRKLAVLSSGFAAAVFAAHYLVPNDVLWLFIAASAALAAISLAVKGLTGKRLALAALGLLCGFGCYLHSSLTVLVPCEELDGETVCVSARVTDFPERLDYCDRLYVRFTDTTLPATDGVIYDYEKCSGELEPGDEISITLKLRAADTRYAERTDTNISKGVYIIGTAEEAAEVTGRWEHSWLYFPQYLGRVIRDSISEVFPEDVRGFAIALLTGSKLEYYADDELCSSMNIAGLAHVVAVSGMHVAFLIGFVQIFAGPGRRSSLICIAAVWVFVIMAGAPSSAVRAGIMQSMLLLAPLAGRINDKATSLSFALAVILLNNPCAAGNIGLQLSFGAMAGIFLLSGNVYNYIKQKIKPGNAQLGVVAHYALGAFSSSVGATVFTVPLIAVHFGYVSLYMFLGNILCLWAVSLAFVSGYAACLAALVFPALGKMLAAAVAYVLRYVACAAKLIVSLPFAALYTENVLIAVWLVLTYALFALFLLALRKKLSPLVPTIASAACLACVLLITRVGALRDPGSAAVLDVGNGQSIVLSSRSSTVMVDCGKSGTADNAGFLAASYIMSGGRYHVDCLLLTHLHADHANGVARLIGLIDVDMIVMPENARQSADEEILETILELAQKHGIELRYLDSNETLEFDGIRLEIYAPSMRGDKNERCLTLTADLNGYRILITGDANMAVERDLVRREDLSDTDMLIVGHHGSRYSTSDELLEEAQPETAVISVGYNTYGHPTEDVLSKLRRSGIEIQRTDLMGRIIIHTG